VRALALALGGLLLGPGLARATTDVPIFTGTAGTLYQVPVKTLVDLRYGSVVRQSYDLSCGAAAMATLLKYYYGEDVGERDLIDAMVAFGDKDKIMREGFSMLELKRYSISRGYVSEGYRIDDAANLRHLRVPALALVNVRGYSHFVVIRSVADGEVHIADPAFGNRKRPLEGFANEWNNVILVVLSNDRTGDSAFSTQATLEGPSRPFRTLTDFGVRPITPSPGSF
jgi:predicted double-glycine peptidase